MNNLKTYSILDDGYSSYFGFTEKEVKDMLRYYGKDDKLSLIHIFQKMLKPYRLLLFILSCRILKLYELYYELSHLTDYSDKTA